MLDALNMHPIYHPTPTQVVQLTSVFPSQKRGDTTKGGVILVQLVPRDCEGVNPCHHHHHLTTTTAT